ncbi:hypothetical protein LXA43DRAFT_905418 [Ganoderma leucocontextum]|nr:hypothetical protein LXA43DRAFT_905418 [Ganoderma leucocontextum]
MDNASTNDVLARTLGVLLLKRYGLHFTPENGQIRCLAHVVNLVVQKILHELFEADDPALQDYYELFNKHLPIHYDLDADEENQQLQTEGKEERAKARQTQVDDSSADEAGNEGEEDSEDLDALLDGEDLGSEVAGASAVKKLRLIVTKILSSPQRRSLFRKAAAQVYKKSTPEDERRRKLIVIRDAIDQWLLWNKPLRALTLTQREWKTLQQLGSMLEVFTNVTKEMSHGGTPTLPLVIPMYHFMQLELKKRLEDKELLPNLRNAAAAGLEKLEQYYESAKRSQYTVLATVLHPSLRLDWLRNLGSDFVMHARVLFEHVYAKYAEAAAPPAPEPAPVAIKANASFLSSVCAVQPPENSASEERTEVEKYFAFEGGKGEYNAPLDWWRVSASVPDLLRTRAITQLLTIVPTETCRRIPSHCTYGSGHSRHPRHERGC